MKPVIRSVMFFFLLLVAFAKVNAQAPNQATFENYLKTVYDAYDQNNWAGLSTYYAPNATEIGPDGKQVNGIAAIEANYHEMEKMVDAKPKFTYKFTSWRSITKDLALIIWDSEDEFSIQGQKIVSKNTCSSLVRQQNGKWLIEFVQLTPKMEFQMPGN